MSETSVVGSPSAVGAVAEVGTSVVGAAGVQNLAAADSRVVGILSERWPTLAGAMARYEQNVAEAFCGRAYDRVFAGLIKFDDRQELADEAESLGIRPFDAQLLIACAIRQWSLDHRQGSLDEPDAPAALPAIPPEMRKRAWRRFAWVFCTAALLDALVIWCFFR